MRTATSRVRRLAVPPALALAPGLAFTAPASAQTTFETGVTFTGNVPGLGLCSNGAYFCGTANIAGYGAASWNLYLISNTNVQSSCGSTYIALTEFTLTSDPSSTLALQEGGYLCAPGLNGSGYFSDGPKASGYPYSAFGTWNVDTADSTGQFGGLGGSGTDILKIAGAHAAGSYNGTLG